MKIVFQNELVKFLIDHGINHHKYISRQIHPILKPTECMSPEEKEILKSYIINTLLPRLKDVITSIENYAIELR